MAGPIKKWNARFAASNMKTEQIKKSIEAFEKLKRPEDQYVLEALREELKKREG